MKGEKRVKYHRELNVVTFVLALFECLCFAGIIFGWFSIRPVLEQEGFFGAQTHEKAISISKMMDKMGSGEKNANETINGPNEVSDPIATQNDTSENADPNKTSECILGSSSNSSSNMADSNAQFNLVFTVSSSALNYSSLLTGFLLDKFGTLVSKLLASLLITSGLFIMAFATPENSWLLFVSFSFLIPIGGYWHFISNFQIGNLFGKWQGTIVTIFSGSFDSSSFVFLLFAELYGFGISLHTIFFVYGCASLYLLVNALFFLPRSYIPFPLPQNWTRNYKLKTEISEHESKNETESKLLGGGTGKTSKEEEGGGDEDDSIMVVADDDNNLKEVEIVDCKEEKQEIKMEVEEDKGEDDVDAVAAEDREGSSCSFWRDCVFTWKYSLHVVFVSVNQLKIYIFLSVVLSFLETFEVDQQQFDTMRRTLGVVQLTGIFWSPIVGLIVDRNKRSSSSPKTDTGDCLGDFALPLLITCVLGTVCSANLLVPYASAQYASFFLQVILRAFNYGLAFSFVACNFPPQHIGKLIGLLMAIAATFSSLQYPIIQYVHATATPPSESSSQSCYPPEPTLDYTRVHILLLLLGVLPFAHPMMVWYQARQKLRKASPKLQDDYVLTDLKRTRTSTA